MILWTLIFGLFVTSTLVQVFYFLKVFSSVAVGKYVPPEKPATYLPVSVVICAHNEYENLKVLIRAMQQQQYREFEVIIALDRCTDQSENWLRALHWDALKLVVINDTPIGVNSKKHALIQGISQATYEHLLVTDGDCYPSGDHWIFQMMSHFDARTELVLGYSPYERQPGLLNSFIRYETLLTGMQYLSRALSGHPYMGVGRNLSYTKSFFRTGGNLEHFKHIVGGDDDLLVNKYARNTHTKICIGVESLMISKPKNSLSAYLRQKKRHLAVGKQYDFKDKLDLGIFSVTHIIFWSSLVSLLVTAMHPIIVITLLVLRTTVLSIIIGKTARRLGEPINLGIVPFMDFLYSIYYGFIGLVALTSKKVKWH